MFLFNFGRTSSNSLKRPLRTSPKILVSLKKDSSKTQISENVEMDNQKPKKTDPIIEKYMRLLSGHDPNMEKVYLTKYGSIRLDADNIITQGEGSETVSSNSAIDNQSLDQSIDFNFIDDHYFNNYDYQNKLHEVDFNSKLNQSDDITNHKDLNVSSKLNSKEKNLAEELNFVDQYYFKNYSFIHNVVENQSDYSLQLEYHQDKGLQDLNYVDRQYFDKENQNFDEDSLIQAAKDVSLQPEHSEKTKKIELDLFPASSTTNNETVSPTMQDSSLQQYENESRVYSFIESLDLDDSSSELAHHIPKSKGQENSAKSHNVKFLYMPKRTQNMLAKNEVTGEPQLKSSSIQPQGIPEKSLEQEGSPIVDAREYVKKLRQESQKDHNGEEIKTGYKKILAAVPRIDSMIRHEIIYCLKKNIIYNDNDILAISKPYGIPAHGGGKRRVPIPSIVDLLPSFAESLKIPTLYPIHRLDDITTGALLLAKTEERADYLKQKFSQQMIQKTYYVIVKGVPKHLNGVIDIPIGEGTVDGMRRMVLRPDIDGFRGKPGSVKKAITKYKVLSATHSCSFIELTPTTGVKHQLRVHLAFGLGCPILGDHKYSHLKKMAPQRLPGDILERLKLKQSKVRVLPSFLHARSLSVPLEEGCHAFIRADLPKFFMAALSQLRLSKSKNASNEEVFEIIKDEI